MTDNAYRISLHFLQQPQPLRLVLLQQAGLARYAVFLTQMPLTEGNIHCVMRFLGEPERVKFPKLQGADLAGLVLDGVNLIRGDLSGADLRGSRLVKGDLLFARLVGADLREADLTGTRCNETLWTQAQVEGCRLGLGIGLTQVQKAELLGRGALFEA
ncbi:pentapeptide repeat-containing protein [Anthocerotibacter panamensis]|uniref:pentapeptide repeat-containing protein n=1 Tax=Anthocerotibacter panamensis TaxID=2857077 RepID=UPI001C40682C|nr:pentapeptide repeat-containing protein [Anthocerotibacter panamensis]